MISQNRDWHHHQQASPLLSNEIICQSCFAKIMNVYGKVSWQSFYCFPFITKKLSSFMFVGSIYHCNICAAYSDIRLHHKHSETKSSFISTLVVVLLWKISIYLIFFRRKQLQRNQFFYHVNMAFFRGQKKWLFTLLEKKLWTKIQYYRKQKYFTSSYQIYGMHMYMCILHSNLYII